MLGDYPRPSVAVDLVVLTIRDSCLTALVIRRREPPFRGLNALPGGFLHVDPAPGDPGEDLEEAAHRVLAEKTGLPRGTAFLEQLHTFGRAGRDPRGRVLSVAYYALVRADRIALTEQTGREHGATWLPVADLERGRLAFDHAEMLRLALERIRAKLEDSSVAFELVGATFSIGELRHVHEVIRGARHDPGNFRRRVQRMLENGLLERAPGKRATASKPAQVYRFRRERRATLGG